MNLMHEQVFPVVHSEMICGFEEPVNLFPLSPDHSYGKHQELQGKSSKFELCAVCGDQSTGYHYEVSSCNGCKTFFRRTITAHRTYKCHKNGNCVFNKDIRCACRSCRFAKCLAVGMNPKAIQCNRTGRIASSSPPNFHDDKSAFLAQVQSCSKLSQDVDTVYQRKTSSPSSSPTPEIGSKRPYTVSALLGLPRGPSLSESTQEERRLSISSPQLPERCAYECADAVPEKRLRAEEADKMISRFLMVEDRVYQLQNSNYEVSESMLDILSKPCAMDEFEDFKTEEPVQKLNVAETINLSVALVIEYAKSFDVFTKMSLEDKIFLLRDVTLALSLLENAYKLSRETRAWATFGNKPWGCEKEGSAVLLTLESLNRAEMDRTEFVLFKSIVFLHAECYNLTSESYARLLKRRQEILDTLFEYVMTNHGANGPVKYGNVLSILWTLFKTAQRYQEAILKFDLEPLCKEILSKKMPDKLF